MKESKDMAAVRRALFTWWYANARDLPWRFGRTTPWGVLVCEVMSQQTQMSRVVPYWNAWMKVWPDAKSLANASTAEVITAWGRLGYPRRALRLQECAKVVAKQYRDRLPRAYDELVALPGIGDYTASAVMSFAFGERIAVIDTNIRRVLSRVFLGVESRGGAAPALERELAVCVLPNDDDHAFEINDEAQCGSASTRHGHSPSLQTPGQIPTQARASARFEHGGRGDTINKEAGETQARQSARSRGRLPGEAGPSSSASVAAAQTIRHESASQVWNQAVMELGALVCTAKMPRCGECPLAGECRFLALGRPGLGERRTRPRQRFAGTNRQVRGLVLNALRGLDENRTSLSRAQLEALWADPVQLDLCIATLDEDGLIEILADRSVRLPK